VSSSADERVTLALENYATLRREGRAPAREAFLARYPSIAGALADCLDGLELVEGVADHFAAARAEDAGAENLAPHRQLGEYRLIRAIGHGGMGVVYEAEQLPLGRRVAVKILPTAASLDPRHRQRFQIEAQAAALLHHEHIVPIFGVGTDAGVHYYAMQYIDGRSLAEIIADLRRAKPRGARESGETEPTALHPPAAVEPPPRPASSGSSTHNRQHWRTAAGWALEAALALEHAHEIGVIHRDIKPSNLLIDQRGHLWVTDFGLARLPQEDHELTRTGDAVGTLRYMSPEQVRGERGRVDTRSDIYSLGVTLCELLTLRPAFDVDDRQELVEHILNREPVPPRRLNSSIPRDLETIVLKAIEKEPAGRYQSAGALAEDLRRFLADEPVRARRPSVFHRVYKWSQRHRPVVLTAAGALVLLLAASTAVLWEAKRRSDASLLALQELRNKESSALQAALATIDQMTEPYLDEPSAAAGSSRSAETTRILRFALGFSQQLPVRMRRDKPMQEVVAQALRQTGRCRLLMGDAGGRSDYRRAIRLYDDLVASHADRIWLRAALIRTLREYAGRVDDAGDAAEADGALRHALVVAESLIGNRDAAAPCFSHQLIGPFCALAWDLMNAESPRPDDAALAVRLARQAVQWNPADADSWRALAIACARSGDRQGAADAVQKSTGLSGGADAADWFVQAAVCHGSSEAAPARRAYAKALCLANDAHGGHAGDRVEIRWAREAAERALGAASAAPGVKRKRFQVDALRPLVFSPATQPVARAATD
jgi:eukaryotic-like serine/threonine-protein kinase